ncbi:MAG: isoprenylcysteine carboxylmethyltransferase family protein [Gammaproteobacteria bacterium]|nr:isoprenylcysteine carboxylmethyltransferase family protein [Gammaproteobacteria bacterium]
MNEMLLGIKIYIVVIFFAVFFLSLFGFQLYIKNRTGESLTGTIDFNSIPSHLRWLPIVASISLVWMLAYAGIFIFQPHIQNSYLPITALQVDSIVIFGCVLVVLGLIVMVVSQFQLGLSYRVLLASGKTELVTKGLYAISRNPLYMGSSVAFTGLLLIIPSWIFLLCLVLVLVNNHFRIREEERFLTERFGEVYLDYCRRVNRYF